MEIGLSGVYVALAIIWLLCLAATSLRQTRLAREVRKDLLVAATYVPLTVGFFWQIIFEEGAHLSRGQGNLASFSFPVLGFAATSVQHGTFPLWNPFLYAGHPIFADAGAALFYPLNVAAIVSSRPLTFDTVQQLVVVHVIIAAISTYAYARVLSLSRLGAFAAGMLFAFGGFAVSRLDYLNSIESVAWLPLVLLLFHLGLNRRSVTTSALAGAVYGLSILAGSLQMAFYVGLILAAYWAWGILSISHGDTDGARRRPGLRHLATLPVCLLAAGGIAAIQIVPTFQLIGLSLSREAMLAAAAGHVAGPEQMVNLVVPYFFGENLAGSWGFPGKVSEAYGYMGVLPLFLAVLGALAWKRHRSWVPFLAVVAVTSLLFALLEPLVLDRLLLRFVPGFAKANSSVHLVFLFDLSAAILAALGLDSISRAKAREMRRVSRFLVAAMFLCVVVGALLTGGYFYRALLVVRSQSPAQFQQTAAATDSLALTLLFLSLGLAALLVHRYSRRYRRVVPMALLVVLAADLFSANAGFNVSRQDIFSKANHAEITSLLKGGLGQARIDTMTGVADVWEQNSALSNEYPDAMGPTNPLMLGDYYRYWENLGSRLVPAYDLLGVRYVLTRGSTSLDPQKFTMLPVKEQDILVYENKSALPRALIVPSAEIVPRNEMLDRLKSPSFDPRRVVLLEGNAPPTSVTSSTEPAGRVTHLEYPSVNEVRATVSATKPAILVLNDTYYPGWRAYVDGKEVPLQRANYTFRALSIPAGDHQVRMVFEPAAFRLGAAVSVASAVILLLAGFGALVAGRRRTVRLEPRTV